MKGRGIHNKFYKENQKKGFLDFLESKVGGKIIMGKNILYLILEQAMEELL